MAVYRYPEPEAQRRRVWLSAVLMLGLLGFFSLIPFFITFVFPAFRESPFIRWLVQPDILLLIGFLAFLAALGLTRTVWSRRQLAVTEKGLVRERDTVRRFVRWQELKEILVVQPESGNVQGILLVRRKRAPLLLADYPDMAAIRDDIARHVPESVPIITATAFPYRTVPQMWLTIPLLLLGIVLLTVGMWWRVDPPLLVVAFGLCCGVYELLLRRLSIRNGYRAEYVYQPQPSLFFVPCTVLLLLYMLVQAS